VSGEYASDEFLVVSGLGGLAASANCELVLLTILEPLHLRFGVHQLPSVRIGYLHQSGRAGELVARPGIHVELALLVHDRHGYVHVFPVVEHFLHESHLRIRRKPDVLHRFSNHAASFYRSPESPLGVIVASYERRVFPKDDSFRIVGMHVCDGSGDSDGYRERYDCSCEHREYEFVHYG